MRAFLIKDDSPRYAPQSPAYAGIFDARYAQSVIRHAHVAADYD
jgi:hypothetical protein